MHAKAHTHDPSDWQFALADPVAQNILRTKLEKAAASRHQSPLTYSDLVRDVEFTLPDGKKHTIIVDAWTDFGRNLIGQHLGCLASESLTYQGFMLSAFAVDQENLRPSKGFYDLAVQFGVFPKDILKLRDAFWIGQMAIAKDYYAIFADPPSSEDFTNYQKSISEGAEEPVETLLRRRCRYLLTKAQQHYRSADGLIHCACCNWAKPIGVCREIVEFHHLDQLSQAPRDGRRLQMEEAISRLQPLCPNCHRIAHSKGKGQHYSLTELQNIVVA